MAQLSGSPDGFVARCLALLVVGRKSYLASRVSRNCSDFYSTVRPTPASLAGREKKEKTMADTTGVRGDSGVGWSAREVQTIAGQAEECGFDDPILGRRFNNDLMADGP